jgi:hypothetical protein
MPFEPNENNRNLTPTGFKSFPSVSAPTAPGPMPDGITSMTPLRSTPTREAGLVVTGPKISPEAKGALGKLTGETAGRVRDFVKRK